MGMLRHVIIEGPDGSGKSGLINRLLKDLPLSLHHRASTSVGGPLADITTWYESDATNLQHPTYGPGGEYGPWIYDRHPLISERIYAMHARDDVPQGKYADADWVTAQLQFMAKHAIMVWCLPPKSHVFSNVNHNSGEQMPGVVNHIGDIYRAYTRGAHRWPGVAVWWDYTHMNYQSFLNDLRQQMQTREAAA